MYEAQANFYALLEAGCGSVPVFPAWPAADAALPCVSYYESGCRRYAQASGEEYLTEYVFTVDIWAKTVAETIQIRAGIDAQMNAAGWARTGSNDLQDPSGTYHKALRYRAVMDPEGRTYQG